MKTLILFALIAFATPEMAQTYQQRRATNDLRRAIVRDVQRITAENMFSGDRRAYYRWKSSSVAPYGELGRLPGLKLKR